jgi:GxxExxY protein
MPLSRVAAGGNRPCAAGPASDRLQGYPSGLRVSVGIVVAEALILEIKAVEQLLPIHDAQILTYLRLSRHSVGLVINFNTALLKNGVRRFVI